MRARAVLLVAASIAASVVATDLPAGASASATKVIVVRPVTAFGHARTGFKVHNERGGQVDCSFADPSPGAVNRNIQLCPPSAEYAIACWKSAKPHRVLCLRDPRRKRLDSIARTGKFAATKRAPRRQRAPLTMVLRNGAICSIRDGGAWGTLDSHPQWVATYSCTNGDIVWAPPNAPHYGVNESKPSWTVRTARGSGGRVKIRHVTRAYFVGTFTG